MSDTSEPQVWTDSRYGGDRIYLGQLAICQPPKYGSTFPGGARSLSVLVELPPGQTHRAFSIGRRCGVTVGTTDVWVGTLIEPVVQDDGRLLVVADGDGVIATRFAAVDRTFPLIQRRGNALNLDAVIDDAQGASRMCPLRRVGPLPVLPGGNLENGTIMMDVALTKVGDGIGKRWQVDNYRTVRFYPTEGTGPRYLLVARDDPGRTLVDYTTTLWTTYVDALTGLALLRSAVDNKALTTVTAREEIVELDADGARTQAQVDLELLRRIYKAGPRPTFTAPFRISPGELMTEGGIPVDLATIFAGGVCTVISADPGKGLDLASDPPRFTMTEVDWDDEAKVLTVTAGANVVGTSGQAVTAA